MRKIFLLQILFCFFWFEGNSAIGFFGSPISSIYLEENGANTGYTADVFNGTDLGLLYSMNLRGGKVQTFKNSGGNVCSAQLFYRIYSQGSPSGSYTSFNISFSSNDGCCGDQTWETTSGSTDLLSSLTPGDYTIEIYYMITGEQTSGGCSQQVFQSNSGANYSANFSVPYRATSSGNFNSTSTWASGSVPTSGSDIAISENVTLDVSFSAGKVLIPTSKIFTVNSSQTLTLTGEVSGSGTLQVNGSLQLNSGGFTSISPTYGSSSTLIYNSGTTYGRGTEWSATSGAGYPHHVQLSNNTTLNLGANTGTGTARQCAGNLTVDAGSTLSLNESGEQMTQALTVKGNFTNNGTVTLSGVIGGDLFIGGDLSNSGTLTHNARLIEFNGTGQQTLSSPLNVDYFEVNNAAGIVLNANLTVGATFNLSNGVIDLQGGSVTVTSGGSITGGSSSSYIKTSSTHGLIQEVGGSAVIFPVGNGSYNPVTISNAGTTDNFTVIVENQVLAEGTTGTVQTANAIGRSWNISEDSPGGSDASITVQWNSSDELTGFDPSACFISHFHQATGWSAEGWDPGATEDVSHSDPRTITLSNVSSFSPFGVGSADSPLPVELQSFHVVEQNNRPLLEWVTLSEINSDLFIIETSRDAKEWTPIAKQKAAGTSNTPTNYEYLDKTTEVDEFIYYRLKQLDLDGTYTYSRVVKFEVEVTQLPVNIYPNPTADVLTFQFGNNVERNIKISNLMGEQIMSLPTISNRVFSVNISNLPKGFYFVEIESGGQVEVKKILKQ